MLVSISPLVFIFLTLEDSPVRLHSFNCNSVILFVVVVVVVVIVQTMIPFVHPCPWVELYNTISPCLSCWHKFCQSCEVIFKKVLGGSSEYYYFWLNNLMIKQTNNNREHMFENLLSFWNIKCFIKNKQQQQQQQTAK